MDMNVAYLDDLLARGASTTPDAVLLESEDRQWTYAQVERLAERGARWLEEAGVLPGDRVLVMGDNSDGFLVGVVSLLSEGAVAIPVSPHVAQDLLPVIVASTTPTAVFAAPRELHRWSATLTGLARRGFPELLSGEGRGAPPRRRARGEAACIIFTSGSTGVARGVTCTHAAILAAVGGINRVLGQRQEDRILCALPFSFDYGLYQVFLAMACGAAVVVAAPAAAITGLPRLLADRRITVLPLVPGLSVLLLRSRMLERLTPRTLRMVTSTGDLLPSAQVDRWRSLLPNACVVPMYGLTECKRVAIMPPHLGPAAPSGSVGLPLPGTKVHLRPSGAQASDTTWGELWVMGPHLMAGYWGDAEATRQRFPMDPETGARQLRSGDAFTRDADGFLRFLGRMDALGHWRGQWLFTAPLEDRLARLPPVDQAAVVLQRESGEVRQIHAFLSTTADAEVLKAEARSLIADTWSQPPAIDVICRPKLPYTANGKIDRAALLASVSERALP